MMMVRPRRVGSFLTSRPSSAWLNRSASSRIAVASSRVRSAADSRCLHRLAALRSGAIQTPSTAVVFGEPHLDVLGARGGHVLADVVGAERQFAVAAVDEHRQLHRARPADVAQRVQRRADRAAGVEDVVDEDDQRAVDAALGDRGVLERAGRLGVEVVAVERDVEGAAGDGDAGELVDLVGEPGGERDAAGRDAEEDDARRVGTVERGLLDDLVRDAGDGPADVRGGHQLPVGAWEASPRSDPGPPSPPLWTDR